MFQNGVLSASPSKPGTVVGRRRGVLVEHLAQSVERRIVQPADFRVCGGDGCRNTRADQDQEGVHQHDHRSDLHFACFDLVSQKFGGAAHHQTADEDGDDQEGEVVHPAYAYAAEPAVDLHVEHLHHTAQGSLRVVHRIDRTVRGDGRYHAPHGRSGGADADLLTLH